MNPETPQTNPYESFDQETQVFLSHWENRQPQHGKTKEEFQQDPIGIMLDFLEQQSQRKELTDVALKDITKFIEKLKTYQTSPEKEETRKDSAHEEIEASEKVTENAEDAILLEIQRELQELQKEIDHDRTKLEILNKEIEELEEKEN